MSTTKVLRMSVYVLCVPKTMNPMYVKRRGCRHDSSHSSSPKWKEAVDFFQNGRLLYVILNTNDDKMAALFINTYYFEIKVIFEALFFILLFIASLTSQLAFNFNILSY